MVFFKLQLVMFFEGIRPERKLIATASLHLAQLMPCPGVPEAVRSA